MQVNQEFKPKIVAFCCNWCSYANCGPCGYKPFKLSGRCQDHSCTPCSCRVNPLFILRAFQRGERRDPSSAAVTRVTATIPLVTTMPAAE